MNKLTTDKRKRVLAALLEGGCSINATVRMTNVSKPTILKLVRELGAACAEHHDNAVRGLHSSLIQCDEVWSFVYAKRNNVASATAAPLAEGDCWTWTALDRDSKLMIAYRVGGRTEEDAFAFMDDLAGRLVNMAQLTSDGFAAYPRAVREAFGDEANYAQLIKVYAATHAGPSRYSPAARIGAKKEHVIGAADPANISTSHVERSNLTIPMSMRRFTRLTNGHSKKIEYHVASLAMLCAFYNFCRVHSSLGGKTPAMIAGIADHAWALDELLGQLD